MEQDPDSPPTFWFQPPTATNRRRKPPIDPVVLIILIPILALIFLFFFLPPFLSHASHILKPGSVKSTWDSLNIFLVLFAILCGVLVRQNDDASSSSSSDVSNGYVAESSSSNNNNINVNPSGQWVGYSDRRVGTGGLRRNSSSYPNLRHESVWENVENNNRNRFFDDFNLYSSPVNRYYNDGDVYRRSHRSEADPIELSDEKEIFVDTFEVSPNIQDFHEQKPPVTEADVLDEMRSLTPLSPPSLPSPPRPPVHRSRHKHKKLERKVSDATKEIATAISSLYNQRKKKNKRKLRSISTTSDTSPPSLQQSQPVAPPPPPPPPPPYRFQNLFKKGGKHKRIHSVPTTSSRTVPPPPPPLPPPPSSIFNNIFKSVSKNKRFHSHSTAPPPSSITNIVSKTGTKSKRFNSITAAFSSLPPPPPPLPPPMTPPRYYNRKQIPNRRNEGKPPLPAKTNSYYEREEFLPSGSQSPLIPMPPPPPPFKVNGMKFEVRGDFVRVRSTHSSVCSSPDRDDVDMCSMDGGNLSGPGLGMGYGPRFHPSPDVNAKAERFISRLKDEWRMEKKIYGKEKMG